jgi:predicted RNase H-like HicB family nuclease
MKTTFTIEYWRDGHWYVGRLREVPGVFSQGKTLAELDENLRDAYRLVLKDQGPVRRKGVRRRPLALAV